MLNLNLLLKIKTKWEMLSPKQSWPFCLTSGNIPATRSSVGARRVLLKTQNETKLRKEGMLESLTPAGELPLSCRAIGTKWHLFLMQPQQSDGWGEPHASANQTDWKPALWHKLFTSRNIFHIFSPFLWSSQRGYIQHKPQLSKGHS